MKILALRFANLNSLEGEWEIDFTRPEYVSDGIFAITGPTGSGKSTILDALCLALYGQTPRLGRVTRSANEIMSRHAGDCFAEVTFSTAKGTFHCHWSQHRSRRKPGGELQAQKHELSDAAGTLIQTKLQETLAAVEELTGMDFDRFTRSMLLAQGGFAAFLQAEPDRRAPVLEQITGTEIYSVISMRVHERQRAERSKLDQLRAETDTLRLLDPEALASLQARLEALTAEELCARSELESATTTLRRLDEIARLEEELALVRAESTALESELEAFAPEVQRLQEALAALSVDQFYIPLEHQRRELEKEFSDLSMREQQRPLLEEAVTQAEVAMSGASEALRQAVETETVARPLHEQVMGLDRQLHESRRNHDALLGASDALGEKIGTLERDRTARQESLETARQELGTLKSWLDEHRADAALLSALSGISQTAAELGNALSRHEEALRGVDNAGVALRQALEARDQATVGVDAATVTLAEAEGRIEQLNADRLALLGERTLRELQAEREALRERLRLLEAIAGLYVEGKGVLPKIDAVDEEIRELEGRLRDAETALGHERQLHQHAEREVVLLEENLRLAARVRSFEEERAHLVDGQPCPLCGSITHPWGTASPEQAGDDENTLRQAKARLQEQASKVREVEIAIVGHRTGIEQRELRLNELKGEREVLGRRCLLLLEKAGIGDAPRDAEPEVLRQLEDEQSRSVSMSALIEKAELLEERIRQEESTRHRQLEALNATRMHLEKAVDRVSVASGERQRLEDALVVADRDVGNRRGALQKLLVPFGVPELPSGGFDALLESLDDRCDRWKKNEARKGRLEQEIVVQETAASGLSEQIVSLRQEHDAKLTEIAASEQRMATLVAERFRLFGDREPAAEAELLAAASTKRREELDQAREALSARRQELGIVDTAIAALRESIDRRRGTLVKLEQELLEKLHEKGFADEQAFLGSRMPESDRERLAERAEAFRLRRQELDTRRSDRTKRLQEARESCTDLRPSAELQTLIEAGQTTLRSIIEELGAIRQQLAENERIAVAQREKMAVVEAQARECGRWDLLHDLIGSADGKKFRNFAQGLTFEIMVAHANRQLLLMTDRYQLVRDASVPLELNVIDTWQAGEIRSTRNLSGGESFIVSLALALGLSQMSSRNVRVDSLFLDEGFGTLDEETLETALETLSSLQQSGKLIGVISHVPALKERISTRIRVTPLTGGRSAISGPGVSRH